MTSCVVRIFEDGHRGTGGDAGVYGARAARWREARRRKERWAPCALWICSLRYVQQQWCMCWFGCNYEVQSESGGEGGRHARASHAATCPQWCRVANCSGFTPSFACMLWLDGVPAPQVNEDFFQKTTSGGVITVVAYSFMMLLFLTETRESGPASDLAVGREPLTSSTAHLPSTLTW